MISIKSYCIASIGAFILNIASFYKYNNNQFYPTVVGITKSKPSKIIISNFFLVCVYLFGVLLKKIFFGSLRDVELEYLSEKFSSSAMDVLLEVAMFRNDLDQTFLVMFVCLQFTKTFHWIIQKRIDHIGQLERRSTIEYIKLQFFLFILLNVDITFAYIYSYYVITNTGPTIYILFAYEFTLLLISALVMKIKFSLTLYSIFKYNGNWNQKSSYFLYIDFIGDFFHLLLYILFFLTIHSLFGFPLYLVRHTLSTFSSFTKRLENLMKYRKAMKYIEKFENATPEELENCHNICSICRESMEEAKKLPCGHIFHLVCLREWFEHQQSCPLCMAHIFNENNNNQQQQQQQRQNVNNQQ